jgi:hypothetical protein
MTLSAKFKIACVLIALGGSHTLTALAQGPRGHRPPPPRPVIINNNYSNNNAGLDLFAGIVGFGAGMAIANAANQPPPPRSTIIVTQPTPSVIVTQPYAPSMVVTQPAPAVTTIVPQMAPPTDVVGELLKMLSSHWASKRRDAATKLGRLRASSAVGPLMDILRNDKDEQVRKSAAWALAEIGDSVALDYLEKTAQFDKSAEVRAAARTSSQKLIEKVAIRTPAETTTRIDVSRSTRRSSELPPPPPRPGSSPPTSFERIPAPTSQPGPFGGPKQQSSNVPSLPALAPPN